MTRRQSAGSLGKHFLQQGNVPCNPRIPHSLACQRDDFRNAEEVVAHVTMKMLHCPLCDWPNKCTIRASGKSLVNAYLKVPNLTFHMPHKTCRQTSICPTSGKVNCSKKTFPLGPYANTLLTIVLQSLPQYIAFCLT
jgi:hypothetical protein